LDQAVQTTLRSHGIHFEPLTLEGGRIAYRIIPEKPSVQEKVNGFNAIANGLTKYDPNFQMIYDPAATYYGEWG
jgi:hypothetical protein